MRILLLGGTTEAGRLAQTLADAGMEAVYSYAGRTDAPAPQPLPTRIGGFGGVAGLVDYLIAEEITHVVDATHPFAAQISRNAITACAALQTPLIALERKPWVATPADNWTQVPDTAAAVAALPDAAARIFLAIGKQTLTDFAAKPQHHYLLRLVDPPQDPLPLPNTTVVLARGPFAEADDTALLRQHNITHIVAKNAGGKGAQAKLAAARNLNLPVIMIDRPVLPARHIVRGVPEVMDWLDHSAHLGV